MNTVLDEGLLALFGLTALAMMLSFMYMSEYILSAEFVTTVNVNMYIPVRKKTRSMYEESITEMLSLCDM